MTTKRIALVTALLIACCVSTGVLAQQQAPSRDQLRLIKYDGDMASLLAALADEYKVRIGFETIPLQPRPGIKIDTQFVTIDEVLNLIVAADPRYQWRSNDGFIDVYPKAGSCALLDTTINEFHVNNTAWALATELLTSLPEVQSQMVALHLRRRDLPRDLPRDSRDASVNPLSITLKDVTLRRALHEITRASGRSFWIFDRPRGATEFSISDSVR